MDYRPKQRIVGDVVVLGRQDRIHFCLDRFRILADSLPFRLPNSSTLSSSIVLHRRAGPSHL